MSQVYVASSVNFTVPAGAGSYAPERIQLNSQSVSTANLPFSNVTVIIQSLVATMVMELWLLLPGTDPTNDANYAFLSQYPGGTGQISVASWRGGQIRVKSGGTAGTAILSASADSIAN